MSRPAARCPLVVVGDALLDRDVSGRAERLSPDGPVPVVTATGEAERPGGAALAALLAAALDGRPVLLVTALGDDAAGSRVAGLLAAAAVELVTGRLAGPTPVKERVRVDGRSLLRIDRADAPSAVQDTAALVDAVRSAGAVLAADYGRGLLALPELRSALTEVARRAPVVWDPHPRGGPPPPGMRLLTPNLLEALGFAAVPARPAERTATARPRPVALAARVGRALAGRWRAGGVAVTMGARGALLATADDVPLMVPAPPTDGSDACGAGDRFAATVAGRLADGGLPSEAVTAGVAAASAYVAAGGPASLAGPVPPPRPSTVEELVTRARAAGGTVVATGGCFDLLHAGHVATLEAARQLGDCLVVCLNSDDSVRRLKGPHRPLVPVADRVRVLRALGAVDAVTVFTEDTPLAVLDRIRPDVWVKGGDYTASALPETELLAQWGGEVVVVPYLEGRSTTRLTSAAEPTTTRRGHG